ncbi:MAG: hypothetical protein JSW54_07915 [Fidelibacterota bacterium]|nr:MAG: hypothetical protein JSW54_07915 [Candidatus Neomarinimicrobiota bacterium]
MRGRTLFLSMLLILLGIGVSGCAHHLSQKVDPLFAGFHRADPAQGITEPILDRGKLISHTVATDDQRTSSVPAETSADYGNLNYAYQDWSRDRYRDDSGIQLNLIYHLNGPYYYHGFQSRFWHHYQRRWHRLPWYASGWMFDDLWWDHMYWDFRYNHYGRAYDPWYGYYDPWYGHYDPWYSYYDPWYYNPYWSYGYPSYGGHYWSSPYYWHGSPGTGTVKQKAVTKRPRSRRDLPAGLSPNIPLDGGMTTAMGSQSGQSQTTGRSTGTIGKTRKSGSGSGGSAKGKQARSRSRQSSHTSDSSGRSAPRARSSTKSSSSSSNKSTETKTSRSRGRKP